MSFSSGSHSQQSEINVTPLIDVLLVLLIIFMVIVPVLPHGVGAEVPQPALKTSNLPPDATVVLEVHAGSDGTASYTLNEQPLVKADLAPRLRQVFATRQSRTMFVKGDAELDFRSIAEAVGLARSAGVDSVGVLTPGVLRH